MDKLIDELTKLQSEMIEKLIRIADREDIARDDLIERFVKVFYTVVQTGNFEQYKLTPRTNADRIRSMSDEELAELLYSIQNLEDKVQFCKNKTECDEILDDGKEIPDNMCKKCLVEWLQEEVEG